MEPNEYSAETLTFRIHRRLVFRGLGFSSLAWRNPMARLTSRTWWTRRLKGILWRKGHCFSFISTCSARSWGFQWLGVLDLQWSDEPQGLDELGPTEFNDALNHFLFWNSELTPLTAKSIRWFGDGQLWWLLVSPLHFEIHGDLTVCWWLSCCAMLKQLGSEVT